MSYSFTGKASDGVITEWEPQPQVGYAETESAADLDEVKVIVGHVATLLQGECTITGGGHSNPSRTPEGSWATDCVNISVVRLKAVE